MGCFGILNFRRVTLGIYTPSDPHTCPLIEGAVTESEDGGVNTQPFAD